VGLSPRHDWGFYAFLKVKNLLFHDAAEFALRRDGLKEIFSDEEVFAIVDLMLAFTASSLAQP
jgi:hypothetical protein